MTADTKPQNWLPDAAAIVELPEDGDESAAADEMLRLLVTGEAGKLVQQIIAKRPPRERIRAWAEFLDEHAGREAFLLFAYSPAQALLGLPQQVRATARWSVLVELYEAWSEVVSSDWPRIDLRSRRISAAYLARIRWLLLSLPVRPGWEGRISPLDLGRVNDGSARILTLARQARDDWLEVLSQLDDYPQLKQDIEIEEEAQTIAALRITRERLREANPGLNVPERAKGEDPDQDLVGGEVSRYVITRLLLPRFALGRVWHIVWSSASPGVRAAYRAAVGVLALTLAAVIFGLADQSSGVLAWVPLGAIAWYVVITITGAVWPATAWPWLMRQPASAAAGLLALAVAPPDWWNASGREWRTALWAVLLLATVGVGYLYMEAGSQDVRRWRRARRPLAVAAFGYLHAVMVAVIGLRFLLPEFSQHPTSGPQLSCWWQPSGCGADALPSWLIVLAAASWSFAAAIFLQIIWDDQPVTAPLAHVSWHRKD